MYRRSTCIFMAAILIMLVFAGCASGHKAADTATSAAPRTAVSNYGGAASADISRESPAAEEVTDDGEFESVVDSIAGGGISLTDVSNAILAERKIIRSANLSIEVENFDEAMNNINSIILGIGIVQNSNVTTDRVYVDGEVKLYRSGTIVLRVDKNKFESVINKVKGTGEVYEESINGEDVTEKYFDIESRLRLLRMEQSKLEAYLAKLDKLEEIFKVESKLTEIRYEIEKLTSNLNRLNSLVELSTITITMREKRPGAVGKPLTYGQRLLNRLKNSLMGTVEFMGDLLIFIISAIPVLVVLGLVILLGVFIYRRIPKRRKEPGTGITSKTGSGEEKKNG
ncbi:MAG: DUF4349 domain-containing protein [Acetivibrionales bacterium]